MNATFLYVYVTAEEGGLALGNCHDAAAIHPVLSIKSRHLRRTLANFTGGSATLTTAELFHN